MKTTSTTAGIAFTTASTTAAALKFAREERGDRPNAYMLVTKTEGGDFESFRGMTTDRAEAEAWAERDGLRVIPAEFNGCWTHKGNILHFGGRALKDARGRKLHPAQSVTLAHYHIEDLSPEQKDRLRDLHRRILEVTGYDRSLMLEALEREADW